MSALLKLILITGLITSLLYLGFELYRVFPSEERQLVVDLYSQNLPQVNASSELAMFMPNMRFDSSNLSYSFFDDCELGKRSRVEEAFKILSTKTKVLNFYEIVPYSESNVPDILIFCYETKLSTEKNSTVAGEGGPKKIINSSLYPVILRGEMNLYSNDNTNDCPVPVVELHELMHVFGFDHISDENSVLYPYVSCKQNLTEEMISKLRELYSIQPKAENYLKKVEMSKAGTYLHLDVEVENIGLVDSNNVKIVIYDYKKNSAIDEMPLNKIPVGTSKTLSIQNLMLPSRLVDQIKLEIFSDTEEYDYQNNIAIARLAK